MDRDLNQTTTPVMSCVLCSESQGYDGCQWIQALAYQNPWALTVAGSLLAEVDGVGYYGIVLHSLCVVIQESC